VRITIPGDQGHIAAYHLQGTGPTVVYVHGFRSHGLGTKAKAFAQCVGDMGHAYMSFDQRGSGGSSGEFQDFTISGGLADLNAVLDYLAPEPVVLVGSSLGGVLAVAAAASRAARLQGMLLIAPAFGLLAHHFDAMSQAALADWAASGSATLWDEYEQRDYTLGYGFYQDAQQFRRPATNQFACPITVVHGEKDEILPVEDSLAFAGDIQAPQIKMFVVPHGDHRLNEAIPLMCSLLEGLCRSH
jgi:pimeloyl-ACP methyl ester carboxylesterase